ncbi:hypothetical protein Tco_0520805 [Tanacetum coccineum]
MVSESLEHAVLAKESSQPKSTYEAAATLTEFELKKILINKMDENKDKDEDPSARSYQGLKKRKTSMDTKPTTGPKTKDSKPGSSKGAKSQSKSSGKSVQSEEPEFQVADFDLPQDQEENLRNDDEEPKGKVASKRDWFTKPKRPQEPTDPDWNVGKTTQQGPTQSWLMTLASSADKPSKTFDELIRTPIDFSAYIMNGLNITNLTQETLLGPAFKLLKGTQGDGYPFDLTKPLPLVMNGNRQMVPVDYFFNNHLKYPQGGISTMTYTTSITKTKAIQYDLPSIKDMARTFRVLLKSPMRNMHFGVFHIGEINVRPSMGDFPRLRINEIEDMLLLIIQNRLSNLLGDDVSDFAIALRMFTRSMVIQKRVKDLQLGVESYQKKINITKPETTRTGM